MTIKQETWRKPNEMHLENLVIFKLVINTYLLIWLSLKIFFKSNSQHQLPFASVSENLVPRITEVLMHNTDVWALFM